MNTVKSLFGNHPCEKLKFNSRQFPVLFIDASDELSEVCIDISAEDLAVCSMAPFEQLGEIYKVSKIIISDEEKMRTKDYSKVLEGLESKIDNSIWLDCGRIDSIIAEILGRRFPSANRLKDIDLIIKTIRDNALHSSNLFEYDNDLRRLFYELCDILRIEWRNFPEEGLADSVIILLEKLKERLNRQRLNEEIMGKIEKLHNKKTMSYSILGEYISATREIILYHNNIKRADPKNEELLTLVVLIHESVHAMLDSNGWYEETLEEPLTEYGMLNACKYLDQIFSKCMLTPYALANVYKKQSGKPIWHYGFGAYIFMVGADRDISEVSPLLKRYRNAKGDYPGMLNDLNAYLEEVFSCSDDYPVTEQKAMLAHIKKYLWFR